MISFIVSGQVLDGPGTELVGLSDIEFMNIDGSWVVVVSSEADSSISTFGFDNGVLSEIIDTQSFSSGSGTKAVWGLTFATVAGVTMLLPVTQYEDQAVFYGVSGTADLGAGVVQSGMAGLGLSTSVQIGDEVYVFAQDSSIGGLTTYRFNSSFALAKIGQVVDTSTSFLGDISAFASAEIGGKNFLFTASAYDTGVSSYVISATGGLILADSVDPEEFSGFYKPQSLLAVTSGGADYLIMASSGTSSLTVYSVGANGDLIETDHVIDTLYTRFQDASLIDSFVFEGRTFIIAAGSDDGITVMELMASGQLWDRGSLADTYDTTLDNVSGISVDVIGGEVFVFVSSSTNHGFTQIKLDMSGLDEEIKGTELGETVRGTSGSDIVLGLGGDDTIDGLGGSDLLIDGDGVDILTGGGGRDIFQFVEDGKPEQIMDYSLHYDQIDLSHLSGVYGLNDIEIMDVCGGVWIFVNNDVIIIQERDGYEINAADFGYSDFLF